MKGKSLTMSMLIFLSAFLFLVTMSTDNARGATLFVGGVGGGNYTTIQSAISDAATGDRIFVYEVGSPYAESFIVPKTVSIVGENPETTIIDGGGASEVIRVWNDWVNISGFTVTNGTYGIEIAGNSVNVSGNDVVGNSWAGVVIVSFSTNTWVVGNEISGSDDAIRISSDGNHVVGNHITNNDLGIVIYSNSNEILDNLFEDNNRDMYIYNSADRNRVIGNTFSYYWQYSVQIVSSSFNRIYHNNFKFPLGLAEDNMNNNHWNDTYPSGGNYWQQHGDTCQDLHSGSSTPQNSGLPDGICDDPYYIDANSIDYYPLKYPWEPPGPPQNLTAEPGNQEVWLSWDPPLTGSYLWTNYSIYRGTTPDNEVLVVVQDSFAYYDTGLTNGQMYFYRVSASDAVGEGPKSNQVNATPYNRIPVCDISSPPSGSEAAGTINVSGTADDLDGFIERVEVRLDNASWIVADGTTSWSILLDISATPTGNNTLYARSFDGQSYSEVAEVHIIVNNPVTDASVLEQLWLWISVLVILLVVLCLLFGLLWKRRKS